MTEIDKKNLKNYLCFTFGITYIAWGILAIFTQSHIFGLETIIGRTLHIVGALGPAIASGFYLKRNNIKFQHFLFSKKGNSISINRNSIDVQSGNFTSWYENKLRKDHFFKMLMQDVSHQLFTDSVLEEVRLGMEED